MQQLKREWRYSRLGHAQSGRLELLHIGMTIGLELVFRKLVSHQTRGVRAGHDALVARENSTHDGQLTILWGDEDQLKEDGERRSN